MLTPFYCQAASDKIIREMELFGPDFEGFHPDPDAEADGDASAPVPPAHTKNAKTDPPAEKVDKAKKGKIAAKATGHKYQFQIMESIGVPRAEIKKFADPQYWLTYFPPIAKVRFVLPSRFLIK